nr:peptidoglycan-binding protein [Paracoccus sp. (in: a-proteobacteria)]
MRALALVIAALLPVAAVAEPVVLRIEAKRGDAAQSAAQGWRAQFPDVVTFPLTGGWTAIALGPMEREAAEARLAELKTAGKVPADSFIAPQPEGALAIAGAPSADGAASADALATDANEVAPDAAPATGFDAGATADAPAEPAPAAAPGSHI